MPKNLEIKLKDEKKKKKGKKEDKSRKKYTTRMFQQLSQSNVENSHQIRRSPLLSHYFQFSSI